MISLYHGSNVRIETVDLSKSKPNKDFGRAFYLSDDKSQAQELAKLRILFFAGEPVVTEFKFDETLMMESPKDSLHIKIFPHYSLEWAEFVWNNRDENQNFHHSYDIVYGPIANDTIGLQMREYRRKHQDLRGFLEGIRYEKGETFQYAFCTERSLQYLQRI